MGGRVWGTFGIALEMSLRKIRNKLKKNRKKALMNIVEQVSLWDGGASFGYMSRSDIELLPIF